MLTDITDNMLINRLHISEFRKKKNLLTLRKSKKIANFNSKILDEAKGPVRCWAEIYLNDEENNVFENGKWTHVDVLRQLIDTPEKVEQIRSSFFKYVMYVIAFSKGNAILVFNYIIV